MPRHKPAAKKGNHASSRGRGGGGGGGGVGRRHGGRSYTETDFVPFAGTSGPRNGAKGFTLQDEARITHSHDFWNSDKKLRHSKVNFISAGTLESSEPKEAESAMARMTLRSPQGEAGETQVMVADEDEDDLNDPMNDPILAGLLSDDHAQTTFVVDTMGSDPVHTGLPPPVIRPSSPTPSNSSEEVILFRGRGAEARTISRPPSNNRVLAVIEPIDQKIRVVEDQIHEREAILEEILHQPEHNVLPLPSYPNETFDSRTEYHKLRTPGPRKLRHRIELEEEALVADYLENTDQVDPGLLRSFGLRELGGDHNESAENVENAVWQDTGESSSDAQRVGDILNSGWGRSDIEDLDDMSTSDGIFGEIKAVLSKRDRTSGSQYLVVWEDHTVDEARWVPSTNLTTNTAVALITRFENEEKLVAEFMNDDEQDSDDTASIDLDSDIIEVEEEDDDEDEDSVDHTINMSDEQIARILAKQEELGLGSEEVLLFDADVVDERDDLLVPDPIFTTRTTSSRGKNKQRSSKRPRGDFPSATLMADAYDGFDVMDFDRPSLQKKPKGRKGKMSFDLSDSELEAMMQLTHENDRLKKKERKQEREELRSQGLLGKKDGKPDLSQKYSEGMGIHAVKEEIKAFLLGKDTTLALPPMHKADRKVVHELANAFALKSKSAGHGNKRFPVLYRTRRTAEFTERAFAAVEAKISRRFLPRMDVSRKRSGMPIRRAAGGGGFSSGAVSYRDGDVVGATAPELGAENKGRAMLEKMGWSSGTALGALNNKGILQPVSHVVKTTKAGLG